MSDFTTAPDFFDSREVIDRIEELNDLIEELEEDQDGNYDEIIDLRDELAELEKFAEEADEVPDWEFGATFIHDSEFTDYARDIVVGCGYLSADLPGWIEIDWETTAENIKVDYSEFTFRGETYWARS